MLRAPCSSGFSAWASAAAAILAFAGPASAAGQSLSLTARSVYHAYEIQLQPGTGSPTRNLNRFYQTLEAGTWGLGPEGDISAVLNLRYDTDFGTGYAEDTPDGAGIPAVGGRNDLDLLYLFVDWKNVIDRRLDLRLGRQTQMDDLDWYVLDGLKLTLHLLNPGEDRLDVEIYAGFPVRWEQLFASDTFIGDGIQVNDAPSYFGWFAVGGAAYFRMAGLSVSGAYRQELIFRDDDVAVFGTDPAAAARSDGTYAMQESLLGFSASYTIQPAALDVFGHLTWNLLVGALDRARAGIGWNPWPGFHFGAEYLRSRPRLLGDSIWNYFNIFPYDKGRFEVTWSFWDYFELQVGYYLQAFYGAEVGGSEYPGSNFNHGPSAGLAFRYDFLSAGIYGEGASNVNSDYGYGGNYRFGYAFVDGEFLNGLLGATLRFSLTTFQNDWIEQIDEGVVADPETSFALNLGVRSRINRYVGIRFNFIKNFSSVLEGSYRVYSELALHY